MQTFLAYADFDAAAKVLDRQRLGKQRVETMQIMKALVDPTAGRQNHPATRMWRGHSMVLLRYQTAICREWTSRGYNDTCMEKTWLLYVNGDQTRVEDDAPLWLGNRAFHRAHQSNLIRKNPEHYAPLFPGVPADLEYIWPLGEVQ